MKGVKVRAWDECRKRYFTCPKWVEFKVDARGVLSASNYDYGGDIQELIVEQYTGCKDCDGVEVYGGDVIKAEHAHKGNIKGVVELSEYEDNEQYIDETHLGWNVNGIPLVDLINEGAVIIGNIHAFGG